jgi:hypothetical protein
MLDHATAERRSLIYHTVIADRLERDSRILQQARERAEGWIRDRSVAEHYAVGWREILNRSPAEVRAFLVDPSESARAFRQVSPFAGVLSPKERWQLWAANG